MIDRNRRVSNVAIAPPIHIDMEHPWFVDHFYQETIVLSIQIHISLGWFKQVSCNISLQPTNPYHHPTIFHRSRNSAPSSAAGPRPSTAWDMSEPDGMHWPSVCRSLLGKPSNRLPRRRCRLTSRRVRAWSFCKRRSPEPGEERNNVRGIGGASSQKRAGKVNPTHDFSVESHVRSLFDWVLSVLNRYWWTKHGSVHQEEPEHEPRRVVTVTLSTWTFLLFLET